MMIQIIILIIVVIFIIYMLYWRFISQSSQKNVGFYRGKDQDLHSSQQKHMGHRTLSSPENRKNDFDEIVQSIKDNFHPVDVKNEEDGEIQLIQFLHKKFPNKIFRHGHTSRGIKIDFVIEGTYALELITVDNEGKLISLMDQMLKSKQDFYNVAVILVDKGKVSFSIITEYIAEFEKIGIKTVLKKVS